MISDQAFIIHKRKYKDSSEIVKLLTRQNGIIDVLAKGSFGNKSKFKGQLHPFIELQVTYTGRSELKTLVDANPPVTTSIMWRCCTVMSCCIT